MGYTLPEASKLARHPLAKGVFKSLGTDDELAATIKFEPKTDGTTFHYNREKALPSVGWVADDGVTSEESAATFDKVTADVRRCIGNVDVDNLVADQASGDNDQTALQIEKKFRALFEEIADSMINGAFATGFTLSLASFGAGPYVDAMSFGPGTDSTRHGPGSIKYTNVGTLIQYRAPGDVAYGAAVTAAADGQYRLRSDNPNKWILVTLDVSDATANAESLLYFTSSTNEPDGLKILMDPNRVFVSSGTDGDPYSFSILDKLIDEVKVRRRRAFVMNSKHLQKHFALQRTLGGTDPVHITIPGYGGQVPTYRSIPILRNDRIQLNETKGAKTNLGSIYLLDLSEEGFWVGAAGGQTMAVDADPRVATVLGFRLDRLGNLEGKDAQRYRAKFYGNFALADMRAAAAQKEIQSD